MRQSGSCFIGQRGMRQKCVKIASKMHQKCAEHLWGRTPFGRYRRKRPVFLLGGRFRIFFIFSTRGRGRGSRRRQEGAGVGVFFLKSQEGGEVLLREGGGARGREGVCGELFRGVVIRQFSSQPPDWKSSWRDFSEVRGGSGGSFRKGA